MFVSFGMIIKIWFGNVNSAGTLIDIYETKVPLLYHLLNVFIIIPVITFALLHSALKNNINLGSCRIDIVINISLNHDQRFFLLFNLLPGYLEHVVAL